MKRKSLIIVLVVGLTVGAAVLLIRENANHNEATHHEPPAQQQPITPAPARIPAHFTAPPALNSLGATLSPEQFIGKAREAYLAARAIPQTLAQLPCYCHCDRGMGHQSLHSCFEDDHASHCAVCVDEALLAYRLQKEENLTADQVRQKIVEKYRDF